MIPQLILLASLGQPTMQFEPADPRQGDLLVVFVDGLEAEQGEILAFDYSFSLQRISETRHRGFVAVPLDAEGRRYPIRVMAADQMIDGAISIKDREFEKSELTVSKKFTKKKSRRLKRRLRRERKAIQALWAKEPTAPKTMGPWTRPVDTDVTGTFGTRRVFNGKTKSRHYGLDLDGDTGDPIFAALDGYVVMNAMRWGSGGTMVLDHGTGLFTMYFHMSKRLFRRGKRVRGAQEIGEVGKSGRVTGPHLHLAVVVRARYLSGKRAGKTRSLYVDPDRAMKLNLTGSRPG